MIQHRRRLVRRVEAVLHGEQLRRDLRIVDAFDRLQHSLRGVLGLGLAIPGGLHRDLRTGKISRDVLQALLTGLRQQLGRDALVEPGDLRIGVRIARRRGQGGHRRDGLQLVCEGRLVGARAILHGDAVVDARHRGAARGIGTGLAGVPGNGVRRCPRHLRGCGGKGRTTDARHRAAAEEFAGRLHGGRCDQRAVGETADSRAERGVEIGRGRRRIGADQELAGLRRRGGRRGELHILVGAVGQLERQRDGVAVVQVGGAEIERLRRRRAGRPGRGDAAVRRGDRGELETKRTGIFRQRDRGRRRRRLGQASVAGADIGLLALSDQLLQPGLAADAVEDVVGRCGRRRIGGPPGKQITIAGLAVEQVQHLVERAARGGLRGGLAVAGDLGRRRGRGPLHRGPDRGHPRQRRVRHVDARGDVGHGVGIAVDIADLRAQPDREAAIDAHAGIAVRLLAGGQLGLQIVELALQIQDPRCQKRCSDAYAANRHDDLAL